MKASRFPFIFCAFAIQWNGPSRCGNTDSTLTKRSDWTERMATKQHKPKCAVGVWWIYALRDPTDGVVRYVGFTTNWKKRLRTHLNEAGNPSARRLRHSQKLQWLRGLLDRGLVPSMELIQSGRGYGWSAAEKQWIAHYKYLGIALTNGTPGGGWDDQEDVDPDAPKTVFDLLALLSKNFARAEGKA